jgi:prevent-host-death family protein
MTVGTALLRAEHIGVRELREHLSQRLKGTKPLIVTERGTPTKVIISYQDILELVEMFDEIRDRSLLEMVREGRSAIKRGVKGIEVSKLFRQIRSSR